MAMTDKERKQLLVFVTVVPILGIIAFWLYVRQPATVQMAEMRLRIDTLQTAVDSARADLQRGTVEDLERRVEDYEASLRLMRQLVPTGAEVANLINDISDRAKLRNIHVADLSPLGYADGTRFRIARYRFVVLGHYDDIGGFLSDIASLPRIMVPSQLSLQVAPPQTAVSLGDTTGAMLQATFQLRTFVKQPLSGDLDREGGAGGAP